MIEPLKARETALLFLSLHLGGNLIDMKDKQSGSWAGKGDRKTRRNKKIVSGMEKKGGNEQWNEKMTQAAIPPIINVHTILPSPGSQGTEGQKKKEVPVAAITKAKLHDICVCLCVSAHAHYTRLFYEKLRNSLTSITTPFRS